MCTYKSGREWDKLEHFEQLNKTPTVLEATFYGPKVISINGGGDFEKD